MATYMKRRGIRLRNREDAGRVRELLTTLLHLPGQSGRDLGQA
jgi:hypothetical protein